MFIFMPFFGQQDGSYIRAVSLFATSDISFAFKMIYCIVLISISLFGIAEIIVQHLGNEKRLYLCTISSIMLQAVGVLIFAISRQPYVTIFLFLILMIKAVLIRKII